MKNEIVSLDDTSVPAGSPPAIAIALTKQARAFAEERGWIVANGLVATDAENEAKVVAMIAGATPADVVSFLKEALASLEEEVLAKFSGPIC